MKRQGETRRLRIVVLDEDTGEQVAAAIGVDTLIWLVDPDGPYGDEARRIIVGDIDQSVHLLLEILKAGMPDEIEQGGIVDLADVVDDDWLMRMTKDLPLH